METKCCTQCNRELPINNFAWRNMSKGTRQSECKECHRKRTRVHYRENKQLYLKRNIEHRLKLVEWFREYKSTLKCNRCPEDDPVCLDFHHIDSSKKEYSVSKMIYDRLTITRILREIEKCEVLCSNCHRKEHRNT